MVSHTAAMRKFTFYWICQHLPIFFLLSGPPEGSPSVGPSRVDFVPNTARPQPTMPIDLSKENFLSVDDVQMSPLPKSQISVVIASYDKTIGMCIVPVSLLA